jgi:hypothetical protein
VDVLCLHSVVPEMYAEAREPGCVDVLQLGHELIDDRVSA